MSTITITLCTHGRALTAIVQLSIYTFVSSHMHSSLTLFHSFRDSLSHRCRTPNSLCQFLAVRSQIDIQCTFNLTSLDIQSQSYSMSHGPSRHWSETRINPWPYYSYHSPNRCVAYPFSFVIVLKFATVIFTKHIDVIHKHASDLQPTFMDVKE